MSRNVCQACQRPEKVCICGFIQSISNIVEVGILQHPTEVKQIKGSAVIAKLSLSRCSFWIGESIDDLPGLVNWLQNGENVFLLYPEVENQKESYQTYDIESVKEFDKQMIKILVLDGTWRKTYKIMQLNAKLRELNRIELNPMNQSQYKIRKQRDAQSLSTVEAIYELLAQLENNTEKYKPLLTAFESMQNQQLAFRQD
ncbi:tRNA-uridine aminocarboxypropyltransferase [Thiomicrorhabdus hydrogeniphila]